MINNFIEVAKVQLMNLNTEKLTIWLEEEEDYYTFLLFSPNALNKEQYGYSKMENGDLLTGDSPGDWKESWIVVGYNEDLGDPLFLDASDPKFPIYTAEHGTGDWEPILLFNSIKEIKNSTA